MHDYKCFFLLSTVPEANFCSFEWTSFKFKEFHNCMQFTTLRFCFPLGLVNYMSHIGTSDGFVIRHFEPYSLVPLKLRDQKVHILKFIVEQSAGLQLPHFHDEA